MSTRQVNLEDSAKINEQDRFYSAWANVGELVVLLLTCAAAKMIGRRLALLANATLIPESGILTNARGCAAAMDMTEDSFKQFAKRNHMPVKKPGDELLYRLGDMGQKFDPPSEQEQPAETTHGRCAKKTPRPPRGKKQGEK